MYKLMKLLNNAKNSKIDGYDVSWTIQEDKLIKNNNEPLFIEWDYIMFEKATKEELEKLQ